MNPLPELFPGFAATILNVGGVDIFTRTGGTGPALLLLHGYPQTHACWHKMASQLAQHFSLVLMDLRGYGQSSAPAGDADHLTYSKRAMAQDCAAVMSELGHKRFSVLSHDRGARVGYRLALDHAERIENLITLDIVPTSEAWDAMDYQGAMNKFHWTFLAQPHPLPEQIIEAATDTWHEYLLRNWSAHDDLSAFDPDALQHYRQSYRQPARIHAMSEDYRAGLTVDYRLDLADLAAGRKISCPTLALWGQRRSLGTVSNTLQVWKKWCDNVEGKPIESGHFLAEENALHTTDEVLRFLKA